MRCPQCHSVFPSGQDACPRCGAAAARPTPRTAAPAPRPGRRSADIDRVKEALPAYEVGKELGRGAWGVVLAARHVRLRRDVAVKQLPKAFSMDDEVRSRFAAEARLLASFDHPHIVPIYDYVEHDGVCLLVMERLTGGTVADRAERDGFTGPAAVVTTVGLCAALDYAHRRGVLHRDVKPENVMFSAEGTLKTTDFGIAKVVVGTRTMATEAGVILGTPAYMAPEQAEGTELGPATDVYAAGTVLYELLSGRLPFREQGNAMAFLLQRLRDEPVPLREAAPETPPEIADVVMRALERAPADRYDSAEQFAADLTSAAARAWGPDWAAGSDVNVITGLLTTTPSTSAPGRAPTAAKRVARATVARRPTGAINVAPNELVPASFVATGDSPARPTTRRWRPVVAVAVAGAVIAAGVGAWVVSRGGGHRPPPGVVFTDDFSRTSSGWSQRDTDDVTMAYADGTYQLSVKLPFRVEISDTFLEGAAFRDDLTKLENVAVEADAREVSKVGGPFGLMCRGHGQGKPYYEGVVDTTGFIGIYRTDDQTHPLFKGQLPDLVRADSPNRLRLQCTGPPGGKVSLRLTVNDKTVDATDASGLDAGRVGVVAATRDKGGVQVRFDNLSVRRV